LDARNTPGKKRNIFKVFLGLYGLNLKRSKNSTAKEYNSKNA
jgi:hypothetical protein